MTENDVDGSKVKIAAGLGAPLVFVSVFTIEGALRPGYDPRSMYVSALALGPRGFLQSASFVVTGVLLVIFARGLASLRGDFGVAGPWLVTIVGLCLGLSGPLLMDPAGTVPEQMTPHGIAHAMLGAVVFTLMPVICFVVGRAPAMRRLRTLSFLAAGGIALCVICMRFVARPPAPPNAFDAWAGLAQRGALTTFFAWVFLTARRARGVLRTGGGPDRRRRSVI